MKKPKEFTSAQLWLGLFSTGVIVFCFFTWIDGRHQNATPTPHSDTITSTYPVDLPSYDYVFGAGDTMVNINIPRVNDSQRVLNDDQVTIIMTGLLDNITPTTLPKIEQVTLRGSIRNQPVEKTLSTAQPDTHAWVIPAQLHDLKMNPSHLRIVLTQIDSKGLAHFHIYTEVL